MDLSDLLYIQGDKVRREKHMAERRKKAVRITGQAGVGEQMIFSFRVGKSTRKQGLRASAYSPLAVVPRGGGVMISSSSA
jgi:hypothetical protein